MLGHFGGDLESYETYCRQLIQKHVRQQTWNTTEPTNQESLDPGHKTPQRLTHTHGGHIALLDMAKAFPSIPRLMLTDMTSAACTPNPVVWLVGEIYHSTPAMLSLHGRELPGNPAGGMKEGCRLSVTLFLLYYDILLRETLVRHLNANLCVFVDDIAVGVDYPSIVTETLNHLHDVAHLAGCISTKTRLKCTTKTFFAGNLDVAAP